MAKDPELVDRLREAFDEQDVREVKMFGGLSFMVKDQLALSASNQGDLLVRCDPDDVADLITEPHVRWAEMKSRKMSKGWLRIDPDGYADDDALSRWIDIAVTHATA